MTGELLVDGFIIPGGTMLTNDLAVAERHALPR
jgi:hypothetical protein